MKAGQTEIQSLRLTAAVNEFKQALLKDLHIPGKPQTSATFELLASLPEGALFTGRTWESWFSKSPVVPKIGSASKLDALARYAGISFSDAEPRFLEKLIYGGLAAEMAGAGAGRDLRLTLLMRAEKYRPASPLHLHLDAIELGTMSDNFQEAGWEDTLAIGARRILSLIHERWCPRKGTVYMTFPSQLRIAWDAADQKGRSEVESFYAGWRRELLEHALDACAKPNWSDLNVDMDISPQHVCRLLLGLVPDADFLQGARLKAWALDLATAGLALHALAWSDRYNTMGAKITIEQILWAAISKIFFSEAELDDDDFEIASAMEEIYGCILPSFIETFLRGRREYQAQISQLGVSVPSLMQVVMRIRQIHPLVYRSRRVSTIA